MAIKSDSPGDDMRDMAADKMENAGVLRKMTKRGKKRGGRKRGKGRG